MTGNTLSFVELLRREYPDLEIDLVGLSNLRRFEADPSKEYDKVFLGTYTWDMGKIPAQIKKCTIKNRDWLLEQDLLIFGSGWTVYETYCQAVDSLNIILDNRFPTIKFELNLVEGTPEYEETKNKLKEFMSNVSI